ncbi:uncharacterized protein BCR38DRAFT_512835 [Pseudomassariella vexata]|uniref:Uncharacterized protein n=1 Tax=Pseudomassariella vexata TaxID=1141098 RepID=A0A1Y2E5I7_9PEZI|nr:uncharacterized protein BCR38DRAFT_512835 [Pseudomassariella vexata]ORY66604.1 hypothetical protein BCR38DRAFT_512835 [Pseudomassariella vexata]
MQEISNSKPSMTESIEDLLYSAMRHIDQMKQQVMAEYAQLMPESVDNGIANDTSKDKRGRSLKTFKAAVGRLNRHTNDAIVELQDHLGLTPKSSEGARIVPLPALDKNHPLNQNLQLYEHTGYWRYKLSQRGQIDNTQFSSPVICIHDGSPIQSGPNTCFLLLPTLKNVIILQHAYARFLRLKHCLIDEFLKTSPSTSVYQLSKKSKYPYENTTLVNVSKRHRFNEMLDVLYVATGSTVGAKKDYCTMYLITTSADGTDAYTGVMNGYQVQKSTVQETDIALPATEATIQGLYKLYMELKAATARKSASGTAGTDGVAGLIQMSMDISLGNKGKETVGRVVEVANSRKKRKITEDD